ncbi:MAG: ribbon-helix-helix protein, CopG family [Bifidobacteriaceae bacterium]|jgi:Arc/MetJ-type ribon-helix-helix transcriptional regulator|nr:ribbon-helix-helix protein, CopG family [Bifidobacteriaceae bacterium]
MTQIVVRLDQEAQRALDSLTQATGINRSEATRQAILLAERHRVRAQIRADAAAVAADPKDAAESATVLEEMAARRAW